MEESEPRHPIARFLVALSRRPAAATLFLAAFCLTTYLPGVLLLPAVDRTEIHFAEATREMIARAAWLDPRYGDQIHPFHTIGTYWAQGLSASLSQRLLGSEALSQIWAFRLPSLLAVLLTVLAVFRLSLPVLGAETALVAAGMFAVAPLTVLVSQLAIGDGLALLPTTIAMLALMRIYLEPTRASLPLALSFWAALGASALFNALHAPILVLVTLLPLAVLDRRIGWLVRLRPLLGLPLSIAFAAPWLIVRTLQDGTPYAALSTPEFLDALSGAQNMKLRARTGTFILALTLGFLPGFAMLPDAIKDLWDGREARLHRFLLAWIAGYLVYLELVSAKPATYAVQTVYPAMAIAVALVLAKARQTGRPPRWPLIPNSPVGALIALGLLAAPYAFALEPPHALALVAMAAGGTITWVTNRHRAGDLRAWAGLSVASLALFAFVTLGVVLPSQRTIWPAREIARAADACGPGPVWVLGFREPSAVFLLRADKAIQSQETIPADPHAVHVVESRWIERYGAAASALTPAREPVACFQAYNVMRGCPMTFTVFAPAAGERRCAPVSALNCARVGNRIRQPDICE